MKLETVMSLGYVKGRYWVSDDMFAKYATRASYKAFLAACREAGFALLCEYSYTAQRYTAEVITYTKMTNSPNYYFFKHNNAYDPNPLAAMGRAAVESAYVTPLVRACVLEMECELLRDAYAAAVERENKQAALEAKLLPVLNSLSDALYSGWSLVTEPQSYKCENCIGMIEHGCYCMKVGAPTPGGPARVGYDEDDDL